MCFGKCLKSHLLPCLKIIYDSRRCMCELFVLSSYTTCATLDSTNNRGEFAQKYLCFDGGLVIWSEIISCGIFLIKTLVVKLFIALGSKIKICRIFIALLAPSPRCSRRFDSAFLFFMLRLFSNNFSQNISRLRFDSISVFQKSFSFPSINPNNFKITNIWNFPQFSFSIDNKQKFIN